MAGRFKEDEKNERTIRNLLKLPANKKCINCNSLGPQYVCTNFWTFVCTTCSGIHREFTHRVKSVSMAKFTSQEVVSLQSGGNERARSIYFKDWDSQRHSYPNNSNVDRLRDFIRHVYVDRRFSGEKSSEKPPRGDDSYENSSDTFRGGSRSPPYEDKYNYRRNDMPSPGGRSDDSFSKYNDKSPGHDRESRYSSDHGRSPGRGEIVNDWRREDRFSNTRKLEDSKTYDGDSLSESRSPDHQKDINLSSPVVRPVREILRDNVTPPKIDPPKQNGIRVAEPIHVEGTASSSSFGSLDGNHLEPKRETLGSLIDFDADPEPPAAAAASVSRVERTSSLVTTAQPENIISNENWASFDFSTESKTSKVQTSSNDFNSLLEGLTTPPFAPAQSGQPQSFVNPMFASGDPMPSFTSEGFPAVPASTVSTINYTNVSRSALIPQHQQQQPSVPTTGSHIHSQQFSSFPATQIPLSSRPAHEDGFEKQSQKAETKSSGRSALPEDLFASTYHPSLNAHQGWHTSGPARVGFVMPYSVPAPMHNIQQPSKSSNPFDFGTDSAAPEHAFRSMSSLHGALPAFSHQPGGLVRSSSVTAHPAYMQYQMPSYTFQDSSYNAGEYFGHQVLQSPKHASYKTARSCRGCGHIFFWLHKSESIYGQQLYCTCCFKTISLCRRKPIRVSAQVIRSSYECSSNRRCKVFGRLHKLYNSSSGNSSSLSAGAIH